MNEAIEKIGPYTLQKIDDNITIFFYPENAILQEEVTYKKSGLCVIFEFRKTKKENTYNSHVTLINKDDEPLYNSYAISADLINENTYSFYDNETDESITIDFNNLSYENFMESVLNHQDLSLIIPEIKKQLELKIEDLNEEKTHTIGIDIPSNTKYYQNVSGYLADEIEKIIASVDEINLTKKILKNIKKNYEVILNDQEQINLSYLCLYAQLLNKVKSTTLEGNLVLDPRELKTDTNKTSLKLEELDQILNSFISSLKNETIENEDLNIIQERIEYILSSKPRLTKFTNYLKIILISEEYVDETRRVRAIKEEVIKDLIINCFVNFNFKVLPRNEVLLYNLTEENVINFCCILSLDKVKTIFNSYKLNREYESSINTMKKIDFLLNNENIKDEEKIELYLLTYLVNIIYYYYNIDSNILLFNKGDIIINLDYKKGEYDISLINKDKKVIGRLKSLKEETKEAIKNALNKSEKVFNSLINKLFVEHLICAINENNIEIVIKDLTHTDILININKSTKKDIFEASFKLDELLLSLTSLKLPREKKIKKEEEVNEVELEQEVTETIEEPSTEYIYGIYKDDYEYIIRKAKTIIDLMQKETLNNKNYEEVRDLYEKLETSEDKLSILLSMAEKLDIKNIRLEEDN